MRFRTEIESIKAGFELGHADKMVLLGSCFTDEVGSRLAADGFDVCANPFGALYNPMSICRCIDRILSGEAYSEADLTSAREAIIVLIMPRVIAERTLQRCLALSMMTLRGFVKRFAHI